MVVACTLYSKNCKELADISIVNLARYCGIHNYRMRILELDDTAWEYKRHEEFEKLCEEFGEGLIFWGKDIDTVITDMDKPITDFLDSEHDMFICHDGFYLNIGSMLLKNTEGGRWLNKRILELRNDFSSEQDVINSEMSNPEFASKVKVLQHPAINSFKYDEYPELKYKTTSSEGSWEKGNFLFHAAALGYEKRIELLKEKSNG